MKHNPTDPVKDPDALLAVFASKFTRGTQAPGFKDRTFDWRRSEGSPENTAAITAAGVVRPALDALTRRYGTDAHYVTYVLYRDGIPEKRQPRINKDSLEWIQSLGYQVFHSVFSADIDNPGATPEDHLPWNRCDHGVIAEFERLWREAPSLRHAWVYTSKKGWRIVQPLTRLIPSSEYHDAYLAWLYKLRSDGIAPDEKCKDWTRMFRLPYVFRDGRPADPHCLLRPSGTAAKAPFTPLGVPTAPAEPDRKVFAIDPPSVTVVSRSDPVIRESRKKVASERLARLSREIRPLPTAPIQLRDAIASIADAVRSHTSNRHELFFCLAGALLAAGVSPESLPATLAAIADQAGIHDPEKRLASGLDAALSLSAGVYSRQFADLVDKFPDVAARFPEFSGPRVYPLPPGMPDPVQADVAYTTVRERIRKANTRLTVIQVSCGVGKTRAAIDVATERARKKAKSPDAIGARAPDGSKTVILVPRHDLAREIMARIPSDIPSMRVFGPLSEKDADGKPVCQLHDKLTHVQDSVSIPRQICPTCEYQDDCPARVCREGDESPRIIVGTHQSISQALGEGGVTALLVVDEPPEAAVTHVYTPKDVQLIRDGLKYYSTDAQGILAPVLDCLEGLAGIQRDPCSFPDLLARQLPNSVWNAWATDGIEPDEAMRGLLRPNLQLGQKYLFRIMRDRKFAEEIGRIGSLLNPIAHAIAHNSPPPGVDLRPSIRVDKDGNVCLTILKHEVHTALTTDHDKVFLDANADINLPVYESVVGGKPDVFRSEAVDGCEVFRALVKGNATRTKLFGQKTGLK